MKTWIIKVWKGEATGRNDEHEYIECWSEKELWKKLQEMKGRKFLVYEAECVLD